MDKLRELIQFPTLHVFKIVGDNLQSFTYKVEELFDPYPDKEISYKESSGDKYISATVKVNVDTYEELEYLYTQISKINGLRFYV